ncbi:MAG TPA: AAA family ATPase [Streptosporangiaceae bacterium]|nr:AAA family ATPase [Streptosporangiaceae bacterium]
MRRFILTGAPGCGKTSILAALRDRGYAVVPEAATDVIARQQARGVDEPWTRPGFIDQIVALQHARQLEADETGTAVQLYDRSPVCTLALARYLDRPVTSSLADEIKRLTEQQIFQRPVFFVRPIGFITPTSARRISYAESLAFERVHESAYREHGFELIDVPLAPVHERAALVARELELRS